MLAVCRFLAAVAAAAAASVRVLHAGAMLSSTIEDNRAVLFLLALLWSRMFVAGGVSVGEAGMPSAIRSCAGTGRAQSAPVAGAMSTGSSWRW